MTDCERSREDLLDLLYGEASTDARLRAEAHLQACDACQEELSAFRQLRQKLPAWTLPSAHRPASPRPATWSPSLRFLAAAAALLFTVSGALALSGSELRYEGGQLSVRLGRGASSSELDARLAAVERRHAEEIQALKARLDSPVNLDRGQVLASLDDRIRQSEARQAVLLSSSLTDFAEKSEARRRYDLARVSQGLSYLDQRTGRQMAKTSELMGYVLQASDQR